MQITDPGTLVAAIPRLLGFAPEHSLVAVWLQGGRIVLTQRVDLPLDPELIPLLRETGERSGADAVIPLVFSPDDEPGEGVVRTAFASQGITVLSTIHVDGDRYHRMVGADSMAGTVGPAHRARARAGLGGAPAPSRDALADRWRADPARQRRIEASLVEREAELDAELPDARSLEAWRDAAIEELESWLAEARRLRPPQWVALLIGLADVRVRDTLLWSIAQRDDVGRLLRLIEPGLRLAPAGYVAPLASLIGLCCWLEGDGARAMIALDRACVDDPDYGLALLARSSIASGIPPWAWRSMMRELPRERCRMPGPLADPDGDLLEFEAVKSVSAKPRLAGRQPSTAVGCSG